MALLIESTVDVAASVTDAVIAAYTARREKVQTMPVSEMVSGQVSADLSTLTAVVCAEQRVAEIVVDEGLDLERLAAAAWALAGRGWDLTVLVPTSQIGDAHTSLRAAPCLIQPWWSDADGIWFGAFETP
ncbi:MAG: hypothetical protein HKN91_18315 [Acidimicrobiia bacterium]|nr:hypothetical protein [Acidimicrobiia bacterium]